YLLYVGLVALACLLYYVWFFLQFGISGEQLTTGLQQIGRYLARMFVWHDFWNWPFGYYFTQIGVTLAIVFAGTLTATVLALLLSFFAARNIDKHSSDWSNQHDQLCRKQLMNQHP
ncbi:hypothetical protein JTL95_38630, partial [Pseudomonas aeruginosa]|nr:hypothetical protein [Pseudomonas aeruginosa]